VDEQLTRRRLLELGLALPLVAAACSGAETEALAPTPACDDGDEPTPEQTEGPFFTPDSPERKSLLEPGLEGTPLVLTGAVLAADCTPISGALLDFWHADAGGEYDNEGYRLRGHQFASTQGRYRLETIQPGLYTGRTRHIHVKAQAPDGPILTTQLYFPGEAGNASDGIFDPALLMSMTEPGTARFDFVLAPG
jgi:protocatechuate 3,4-dioxygenase beta subunit